jgi:hypothetical protein
MKEINLTDGQIVLVDDWNYDWLMQYRWCPHITSRNNKKYIYARISGSSGGAGGTLMHRIIMGLQEGDGLVVDHIDDNGLNDQESNMRITTKSLNTRRTPVRSATGVKGVMYISRLKSKPYRVECVLRGSNHFLGYYASLEEAAGVRQRFLRNNGVILLDGKLE